MFDKMIFNVCICFDKEALQIAEKNRLQQCTEGKKVFYQSTQADKFNGVHICIKDNKVQIKCSLHKVYYNAVFGTLDNSGQFTISNARNALKGLFAAVGVDTKKAKITYYEIGMNIPTTAHPIEYIEKMYNIGKTEKELFNDANFRKNRQKTTEKSKTIKKVFKVYDKGFEMADRKRTDITETPNILRIETMYRRQNISVSEFFKTANISRITKRFYNDWEGVEFIRPITAAKGIRQSQKHKAERLLLLGRNGYLDESKAAFEVGSISEKEYRGVREFVRDWDSVKHLYKQEPTTHETEYRDKLFNLFKILIS